MYAAELRQLAVAGGGLAVSVRYTREAPDGHTGAVGRLDAAALATASRPADEHPWCFVCGPTGFVEATINHLVALGHEPRRIKAERFGGSS